MGGEFQQVFLVVISAAMALGGLWLAVKSVRDYLGAVWVPAVVTGYQETVDSEGSTLYSSRFEYEADGRTWQTVDDMGFSWKAHRLGATVWIGYPPDDPAAGRPRRLWPAAIGAVLFVVGVVVLVVVLARG